MDFATASELKAKGFNQVFADGQYVYLNDGTKILFDKIKGGLDENGQLINYYTTLIMIPTLEQIIATTGSAFDRIVRGSDGKFITHSTIMDINDVAVTSDIDTSDAGSSVADLYINLVNGEYINN